MSNYSILEVSSKDLTKSFEVHISADEVKKAIAEEMQKFRSNLTLKGFRKGKVPKHIAENTVQAKKIKNNVVDELYRKSLEEIYSDMGMLVSFFVKHRDLYHKDGGIFYELETEIFPEEPAVDIQKIAIKKYEVHVDDTDVTESIQELMSKSWIHKDDKDSDEAAAEGDAVTINLNCLIDEKPFEGGSGTGVKVVLGMQQLIPEFEKNVINMKSGEQKEFTFTFPKDYHNSELAGKEASCSLDVISIVKGTRPTEEEDLLSQVVSYKTVDEMRQAIRKRITDAATAKAMEVNTKQVINAILAQAGQNMPQPAAMLNRMVEVIAQREKLSPTEDREKILEDYKSEIYEAIVMDVFVAYFARKNSIAAEEREINALIFNQLKDMDIDDHDTILSYINNQHLRVAASKQAVDAKVLTELFNTVQTETISVKPDEIDKLYAELLKKQKKDIAKDTKAAALPKQKPTNDEDTQNIEKQNISKNTTKQASTRKKKEAADGTSLKGKGQSKAKAATTRDKPKSTPKPKAVKKT